MVSSGSVGRLALAAGLVLLAGFVLSIGPTTGAAADGNVTVYRASDGSFDDADDVEAAIAAGAVEPADEAVVGETLVVAIESDRLADSVADRVGPDTQRFLDALDGDATFRIAQTNPSAERPRKVAPVGSENVTVHRAGTTTYVLVDTGALRLHFRGNEEQAADVRDGDRFAVAFGYGVDEFDTSGPEVELYSTEAEVLTRYRPEPLEPGVVNRSVRVNVAPDGSVLARLTVDGGRTITAPDEPIDSTGHHDVSFDLTDVEAGSGYTLELVHDGTVVDRVNGTVVEPRGRVTDASLTEVETEHLVTRSGRRVTERVADHVAVDATVTLSHGGRVQVLDETCHRVGSEWVEPGVETSVSIDLWNDGEPIRRRNLTDDGFLIRSLRYDDGRMVPYFGSDAETTVGPYDSECPKTTPPRTDGSPRGTPTRTDGDTPTPMATASTPGWTGARTDVGDGPHTDGQTASQGQPGFTALAAVVAILVLALDGPWRR